jgi:hypothetical protein
MPQREGVVGNRRSHVNHKPACRGAAATAEKNRVTFASEAEAQKAGDRRAGDCPQPPRTPRPGRFATG